MSWDTPGIPRGRLLFTMFAVGGYAHATNIVRA